MMAELHYQLPVNCYMILKKSFENADLELSYYLYSFSHNTGFSLLTFKCCDVVTWIL